MRYHEEEVRLATALETFQTRHSNDSLKRLLKAAGQTNLPTRKDELVARVMALLGDDALRAAWAELDALRQSALAEVAWSRDGFFNRDQFKAKYGKLPAPEVTESERNRWSYGERRADRLDLFMPNDRMPKDIQARLRAFAPKPAAARVATVDAPPDHVDQKTYHWNQKDQKSVEGTEAVPLERREMERAAAHDLLAVLRLTDAGKVSVTDKNRWPTPGTIRQVSQVLHSGDFYPEEPPIPGAKKPRARGHDDWADEDRAGPIRAFAWPMLLQAGKLARVDGPRLAPTKAGRAALTAPPHETLRELWQHWLGTDVLDELRRVNVIRGQTGKGARYLTDPAERRAAINDALCKCPVGRWATLDEFSRYMRAGGHEFSVARDGWGLYIADAQYGSLATNGGEGWNILEFRYLLTVLMEYAATLGLIDVAYLPPAFARHDYGGMWGTDDLAYFSRYDGLWHLRLNPLGAYCLGVSQAYAAAPLEVRKVLNVLPNLEVVATVPLPPADRMLLETFAEKSGDHVWRLERDRMLAALAEGRSVVELRAFLEASGGAALPQTVAQFLTDVEGRAAGLRDLGEARLVRCADAALAALIANDSAAGKTCSLLAPDRLVVPGRNEAAFRRAVRKLGYVLPRWPAGSAAAEAPEAPEAPAPAAAED